MNPPTRLLLHIRSSRYVVALIVVTHALTAGLLFWLPLSLGLRFVGPAVVASACAVALRRVAGRASLASLQIGLDRRILITTRGGQQREGEVLADSYVGSRVTTIVWRPDGARIARTVLILADTLPADDFRQLRVVLRYSRSPAPVAGSSDVDAA